MNQLNEIHSEINDLVGKRLEMIDEMYSTLDNLEETLQTLYRKKITNG